MSTTVAVPGCTVVSSGALGAISHIALGIVSRFDIVRALCGAEVDVLEFGGEPWQVCGSCLERARRHPESTTGAGALK